MNELPTIHRVLVKQSIENILGLLLFLDIFYSDVMKNDTTY